MPTFLHGFELYQMPEFKTLCEKIGIPWGMYTKGLTISLPEEPDDLVVVTQSYILPKKTIESADSTTQHNKEFRTRQPCPRLKETTDSNTQCSGDMSEETTNMEIR